MKTYKVTVDGNGTIRWYKEGTETFHREDGPAIEYTNGFKFWYLNGERLTEQEFNQRMDDQWADYYSGLLQTGDKTMTPEEILLITVFDITCNQDIQEREKLMRTIDRFITDSTS